MVEQAMDCELINIKFFKGSDAAQLISQKKGLQSVQVKFAAMTKNLPRQGALSSGTIFHALPKPRCESSYRFFANLENPAAYALLTIPYLSAMSCRHFASFAINFKEVFSMLYTRTQKTRNYSMLLGNQPLRI